MELYCLAIGLFSPLTLLSYGWDKWSAKADRRRIPEKRLHLLALLGGWPGSVWGQRLFRHKTMKTSFRAVLGVVIALHLALTAAWGYFQIRPDAPTPVETEAEQTVDTP